MIRTQAQKIVWITEPAAIVDNAAFTTASIDTLGWDYCDIYVHFGAMDIAMAALKLQESDADSGYADVSGGDYSAALPSATADNTTYAWHVNLNGPRKRFLDVAATGGDGSAGTYMTAFAILSRAESAPNTATTRGLTAEKFV